VIAARSTDCGCTFCEFEERMRRVVVVLRRVAVGELGHAAAARQLGRLTVLDALEVREDGLLDQPVGVRSRRVAASFRRERKRRRL
jgi:hypothetical protein